MREKYIIFQLDKAVDSFNNSGIGYDEHNFTLYKVHSIEYDTVEEAEGHIKEIYEDYNNRKVIDRDMYFIIEKVYVFPKNK